MPEIKHEKKYDTVVSSGQSALKALLTMNGGASLAFLAFVGNALKEHVPIQHNGLVYALQFFIAGTFMTVCAFGTIFLTNCFSSVGWRRTSNAMFALTLFCGFASLGCFVWASGSAIRGFAALPTTP
jgi:hypothetical protein